MLTRARLDREIEEEERELEEFRRDVEEIRELERGWLILRSINKRRSRPKEKSGRRKRITKPILTKKSSATCRRMKS